MVLFIIKSLQPAPNLTETSIKWFGNQILANETSTGSLFSSITDCKERLESYQNNTVQHVLTLWRTLHFTNIN